MDYAGVLNRVEKLAAPILEPLGLLLVEREFVTEYGRLVLRVYVEREGDKVSLEDCEAVSRALESLLDVDDLIPSSYVLEVSSPGLDRPLRRREDFERFTGHRVQIKTNEVWEGYKSFTGQLLGLEGEQIVVRGERGDVKIPFSMLAKARIKP